MGPFSNSVHSIYSKPQLYAKHIVWITNLLGSQMSIIDLHKIQSCCQIRFLTESVDKMPNHKEAKYSEDFSVGTQLT